MYLQNEWKSVFPILHQVSWHLFYGSLQKAKQISRETRFALNQPRFTRHSTPSRAAHMSEEQSNGAFKPNLSHAPSVIGTLNSESHLADCKELLKNPTSILPRTEHLCLRVHVCVWSHKPHLFPLRLHFYALSFFSPIYQKNPLWTHKLRVFGEESIHLPDTKLNWSPGPPPRPPSLIPPPPSIGAICVRFPLWINMK